jgi:hypothetical protein
MTVRSSSKQIQTLMGPFYAVLFAIIVFKKYLPTYLSSVSRGGQFKTGLNIVLKTYQSLQRNSKEPIIQWTAPPPPSLIRIRLHIPSTNINSKPLLETSSPSATLAIFKIPRILYNYRFTPDQRRPNATRHSAVTVPNIFAHIPTNNR